MRFLSFDRISETSIIELDLGLLKSAAYCSGVMKAGVLKLRKGDPEVATLAKLLPDAASGN
jgi:hypothetical protein